MFSVNNDAMTSVSGIIIGIGRKITVACKMIDSVFIGNNLYHIYGD